MYKRQIFEFNKQFKEPLITYEGDPVIFYPNNGSIPDQIPVKEEMESETVFRPSKDKILTKKPSEDLNANPSYETSVSDYSGQALVESVGYTKPQFLIKVKNMDYPDSAGIIITPDGGIDPLQWDEATHKIEAEKILIQQGKQDLLDSAQYQKEWEDSWARVKDPRPWTKRFYEPGNYSFEIDEQSIDSYDIQIKIPDYSNGTQVIPSEGNYEFQKQNIKEMLDSFAKNYNQNVDSDYLSSLSRFLTADQKQTDRFIAIYRELSQARASGYTIDDVVIDTILIQGSTATVRGELSVFNKDFQKNLPLDIIVLYEDGAWKIQTVLEIR